VPQVIPTALPGLLIIEPDIHRDARGIFLETFHAAKYRKHGIPETFLQDNHSVSRARTLRGLHFQRRNPQGKLVRVIQGTVLDIAVDVRIGSPTFGLWAAVTLSCADFRQAYVPPGFAHGFYVLDGPAHVEYKCTSLYDPESQMGVAWNDPQLAIRWPDKNPILSASDARLPPLTAILDQLPTIAECPGRLHDDSAT
jgi:dTDP-4-dehydrorhamnose 3,5-epimerase